MRVASLFSGCGGFDFGFKQAGHEIVFAIDNDAVACATYEMNIQSIINAPVQDIDVLPDCDIVIGGPPCQDFSIANWQKYRGRGALALEFARLVLSVRPPWFLMENVRGLLRKKHARLLQAFLRLMLDGGYMVSYRLLDAADYGVPQNRVRLFIMGNRVNALNRFPLPTHSKGGGLFEKPWVSIGKALNLGKDVVISHQRNNLDSNQSGRFYKPDRPARTITTRPHRILSANKDRYLTVAECAKLQTFPNEFVFAGTKSQQYQQIGNAVPPLLARRMAEMQWR